MVNLKTIQLNLLDTLTNGSMLDDLPDNILIYQRAYRVRLYNALADNFPSLFKFLDDENFSRLANSYISDQPSKDYNLQNYGTNLATYLKIKNYPDIYIELVNFDLMVKNIATRAEAIRVLTLENFHAMASQYGDELKICLANNVQLSFFNYDVIESLNSDSDVIDLNTCYVICYQKELIVYYDKLTEDEYYILMMLKKTTTFIELWHNLLANDAENALLRLQKWLTNRWLSFVQF